MQKEEAKAEWANHSLTDLARGKKGEAKASIGEVVTSLVKQSMKQAAGVFTHHEHRGLLESGLFQVLAGVKIIQSAEALVLLKREREHSAIL